MAVAVDATSTAGGSGVISLPHVCSGTNRLLLMFVCDWTGSDSGSVTVAPRYAGIGLTQHTTHAFSTARCELWYLINPATGSNPLAYTLGVVAAVAALSVTGAHQTTPLPQVVSAINGPNPPASAALTVPSGDLWAECLSVLCSGSALSPGAGFVQQATIAPCNPKAILATQAGTGASLTDTWTGTYGDGRYADLALWVQQAPGAITPTVPTTKQALLGVGG